MKMTPLSVVLPLAALFAHVHASALEIPQGSIVSYSTGGEYMPDNQFYTESAWQSVLIPERFASELGNFKDLLLTVTNVSSNVHFKLVPEEAPGQVGISVWRTNQTQRAGQVGIFTLTNPVTHFSYTFQAMVLGSGT